MRRQHNHATRRRESACFRDARPPRGRAAGGGNVAARASLVHALGSGVVCLTGGAPLHARPLAAKAGSCATRAAACTATAAERGRSSPRRQQQLARTRAFCSVRERFGLRNPVAAHSEFAGVWAGCHEDETTEGGYGACIVESILKNPTPDRQCVTQCGRVHRRVGTERRQATLNSCRRYCQAEYAQKAVGPKQGRQCSGCNQLTSNGRSFQQYIEQIKPTHLMAAVHQKSTTTSSW